MMYLFILVLFLCAGISYYFKTKAREYLSDIGRSDVSKVKVIGIFAMREYFTQQGWRYHNIAVVFMVLGWLSALFMFFYYGFRKM